MRGRHSVAYALRVGAVVAVLVALAAFYELYRWIWSSAGWTHPFPADDTTMPHVWVILHALWQPAQVNQPALGTVLFHKALFTAKEALAGFAVGGIVGFALAVVARPLAPAARAASCRTSSRARRCRSSRSRRWSSSG